MQQVIGIIILSFTLSSAILCLYCISFLVFVCSNKDDKICFFSIQAYLLSKQYKTQGGKMSLTTQGDIKGGNILLAHGLNSE